jgi:hypothetical protein
MHVDPVTRGGLAIFDISDPKHIRLTGFTDTSLDGPTDVFVAGSYAYVTSADNNRLVVFDVSDPRVITPKGYTSDSLVAPVQVHVSGNYAYVTSQANDRLVIFDVSNPAQIAKEGQVATGLIGPRSVYVSGDRAYVAYAGEETTAQGCGLAVLDVSDPAGIAVLNVIDMSDWLKWVNDGTPEEPDWQQVPPKPIAVSGNGARLYLANELHDSVTLFEINHLEAPVARAGELLAGHLDVTDDAAVSGDLDVRGGLNVGAGGALIQGALSVSGQDGSHILGALSVGGAGALISDTAQLTRSLWVAAPTHVLDVVGEGRFRVNDYHHLVLRSPNAGTDEDAYIDFVRSDQTDVITPSARIEFDAAGPFTHSTSIHFQTQGSGDATMTDRMEITEDGDLIPGASNRYLLGSADRRWDTVYTQNGVDQISDGRYKDQIRALSVGLDEVVALRPVIFSWIEGPDEGLHYGLIAQEVRAVLPEVVSGDDQDGTLSMNYSGLVPVLVKAVQDQQEEIDLQAEQIVALEERLAALEGARPAQETRSGVLNTLTAFGFGGLVLGAVFLGGMRLKGG